MADICKYKQEHRSETEFQTTEIQVETTKVQRAEHTETFEN